MEETLMELEEKCHEAQAPQEADEAISQAFDGKSCCHSQSVKWRPANKPADKKCFCTACITGEHSVQMATSRGGLGLTRRGAEV